jgi:hypothetical protein
MDEDNMNFPTGNLPLENGEFIIHYEQPPFTGLNTQDLGLINTNFFNSSRNIELLNLTNNSILDPELNKIIDIHRNLLSIDDINLTINDIDEKDSINEKLKEIDSDMESIYKIMESFKIQQKKMIQSENNYKESYKNCKKDLNKISDFKEFAMSIDTKYKDLDSNKINKCILEIVEKISKDNNTHQLKQEYLKENYIYNHYLHKLVKYINGINVGNTCSICLQNKVDTFLDPCGHTACSACVEILKGDDEFNCNCFICRKTVNKFHKLYFS